MSKLCIREWKIVRGWMCLSVFLGLVCGIGLAGTLANAYYNLPDGLDSQQRQMAMACKLPDRDGAMTVFILEDGKLKCWRWK